MSACFLPSGGYSLTSRSPSSSIICDTHSSNGYFVVLMAALPEGFVRGRLVYAGARIVEELNRTWEFTQKTINGMSNSDFAILPPKLGPKPMPATSFTFW